MRYFLNHTELEQILLKIINKDPLENETLSTLLDHASNWHYTLSCLTYSVARVIERHRDAPPLAMEVISKTFSLENSMSFEVQECGEEFVEFMVRGTHEGGNNIEEDLLKVAEDLAEYCYDNNTIRH